MCESSYYDYIINHSFVIDKENVIIPNSNSGNIKAIKLLLAARISFILVSKYRATCRIERKFFISPYLFQRLCSCRYVTSCSSVRFLEDESIFPDCAERFSSTWSDRPRGMREEQGKRMRECGNK